MGYFEKNRVTGGSRIQVHIQGGWLTPFRGSQEFAVISGSELADLKVIGKWQNLEILYFVVVYISYRAIITPKTGGGG